MRRPGNFFRRPGPKKSGEWTWQNKNNYRAGGQRLAARLDFWARGLLFEATMLSETLSAAAENPPPATPSSSTGGGNRAGWVRNSVARVRAALVERQIQPLSRTEWAELRASLAAIRPAPPPNRFRQAGPIFRP
jgi:hypothetical protein